MYGEGLTVLRPLYKRNGSKSPLSAKKRCEGTIWNASPARMYSFAFSTASS
jgi:hypothetical protein